MNTTEYVLSTLEGLAIIGSIAGIVIGSKKQNKAVTIISVIACGIFIILAGVYLYLYAKNSDSPDRQTDAQEQVTDLPLQTNEGSTETEQEEQNSEEPKTLTYKNTAYGFSLTYNTAEFSVNEKLDASVFGKHTKVAFVSKELEKLLKETGGYESAQASVTIGVYPSVAELSGNQTSGENLEQWLKTSAESGNISELKEITFAGMRAFSAISSSIDAADPQIYIEKNGKIFVIHNEHFSDESDQNKMNEQLINTFTFIK